MAACSLCTQRQRLARDGASNPLISASNAYLCCNSTAIGARAMAALDETDEAEDIFDPGLFLNEDYAEHAYELGDGAQQTCLCLEGASTDHDLTGQVVWPVSVALARFVSARLDSRRAGASSRSARAALAGLAAARAACTVLC